MSDNPKIMAPVLPQPDFLVANQRFVCFPISKQYHVTPAGIHIVTDKNFDATQKEVDKSTTDYANHHLFIVGMPANASELLPLPSVKNPKTKKMHHYEVEIGDIAVISDIFLPVEKQVGSDTFLLIHSIDILGVTKTPKGAIQWK